MIREVVDDRRMPPWHADPRYGHFVNDRSLTTKERATLLAWVDQGAPLGDPTKLPAPRTVSRRLDDRQARRRLRAARDLLCSRPGSRLLRLFPGADQLQGRHVGPGGRGRPGRPVGRPPHHRLCERFQGGQRSRRAAAADAFHRLRPGRRPSVFPEGTAKKIPAGADLLVPGPLHADRTGPDRPLQAGVGLRQDQADPRGVHDRHRQPRPACCRRTQTTSRSLPRWSFRATPGS